MINERKEIVKFDELGLREQIKCMDQYINVLCPYDNGELNNVPLDIMAEVIDLFVDNCNGQFYFDERGNWYDEGRMVRCSHSFYGMCEFSCDDSKCDGTSAERWECAYCDDYEKAVVS